MNLIIRKATAKDIPSIVKVRRTAFTKEEVKGFSTTKPSIYYSAEELEEAWDYDNLLKDGWEVVVAEDDQKIVGFIVFKLGRNCGYLENINIAKDMQKKGIGRALVTHVEKVAKSTGIHVMKTDTTENASGTPWKSYTFWKKLGYKDTGERLVTEYSFKEIPLLKELK